MGPAVLLFSPIWSLLRHD